MKAFLSIILLSITLLSGCSNTMTDYPPVFAWNDYLYHDTGELVESAKIDQQIGEVKKKVGTMPKRNEESNDFPAGSKIFSIKDSDQQKEIAVEKNGEYHRATKGGSLNEPPSSHN